MEDCRRRVDVEIRELQLLAAARGVLAVRHDEARNRAREAAKMGAHRVLNALLLLLGLPRFERLDGLFFLLLQRALRLFRELLREGCGGASDALCQLLLHAVGFFRRGVRFHCLLRFGAGDLLLLRVLGGAPPVILLLIGDQGALGREVEEVGVLLAVEPAVRPDVFPGILRAERRLHVFARAFHIGKHQNRRPRLHRHARRQLANRERDRFRMRPRRLHHAVEALLRLRILVRLEPPVAGGEHDAVLLGAQAVVAFARVLFTHLGVVLRREAIEEIARSRSVNAEPLRLLPTLDALVAREVVVEIVVGEIRLRAVRIACFLLPFEMRADVHRMRLLLDALLDGLPVRIADLRPAVMRRIFGVV